MVRKFGFTCLVFTVLIFYITKSSYAFKNSTELSLYSDSAVVIDADSNRILYGKNEEKIQYPASTTKILTMLLALELCDLNETTTISAAAKVLPSDTSKVPLHTGEIVTIEQLIYSSSLPSANEAANAIGEHISGTMDEFGKLMTEKAIEIGTTNTNFVNPSGLHDSNHYSTAYDMALIMAYAINVDKYLEITNAIEYTIPVTNMRTTPKTITTTNKIMLPTSKFYMSEAISSKTGYTYNAKCCLATYASKDGVNLIVVVMKAANSDNAASDTKQLLEYGFDNFIHFDGSTIDYTLPNVQIEEGYTTKESYINLFDYQHSFSNFVIDKAFIDEVHVEINIPTSINQTYDVGNRVGKATLYYGEVEIESINIVMRVSIIDEIMEVPNNLNKILFALAIGAIVAILILLLIRTILLKRKESIKKKI